MSDALRNNTSITSVDLGVRDSNTWHGLIRCGGTHSRCIDIGGVPLDGSTITLALKEHDT